MSHQKVFAVVKVGEEGRLEIHFIDFPAGVLVKVSE